MQRESFLETFQSENFNPFTIKKEKTRIKSSNQAQGRNREGLPTHFVFSITVKDQNVLFSAKICATTKCTHLQLIVTLGAKRDLGINSSLFADLLRYPCHHP